MNILVRSFNSYIHSRPDSCWEKEKDSLYLPDTVKNIDYSPVLFIRIHKACKSIQAKFAERYYESFNYGFILYPCEADDKSSEGYAQSLIMDQSCYFPLPLYNLIVLDSKDNYFRLLKNDLEIFCSNGLDKTMINSYLEHISSLCSLKTGDIVAIELAERSRLFTNEEKRIKIKSYYCDNQSIELNIIAS